MIIEITTSRYDKKNSFYYTKHSKKIKKKHKKEEVLNLLREKYKITPSTRTMKRFFLL